MNRHAVALALLSAALFGVSTPLAKVLLGYTAPTVLAGLLYCGAGLGAGAIRRFIRAVAGGTPTMEAALSRGDIPWLAGAIVCGGILGPILLMIGLVQTAASTASLLLTLEGAATALLAWFVFGENVNRRVALGMGCLVLGALVLAWSGAPTLSGWLGPAAIVAACIAWGIDNNLTRKISLVDPLQIVQMKGLVAGPVNVVLGIWLGGGLPSVAPLTSALGIGLFSYGISLALFVLSLRHLGTARTGAYYSTAPFFGAVAAVLLLDEPVTGQLLLAAILMALGVALHLTESHAHEHEHLPTEHTHSHWHDEHHRHEHKPGDPKGEPHAHKHHHGWIRHSHEHVPDMHHLHRHGQ